MYSLFESTSMIVGAVTIPAEFEMIKRTYLREIEKITNYYANTVYSVKSNHILCRIINSGYIPIEYDIDKHYNLALQRASQLGTFFGLTSSSSYGKIFIDGPFYGPGNKELIINTVDLFDPRKAVANWRDLSPVTVLYHPVSDFSLLLPEGKKTDTASGLTVMNINIALLLTQYRQFCIEQITRYGTDSVLPIAAFVKMHVIPKMLSSHIDIVLMNRLLNLYYGSPMSDNLFKYPFNITDYSDRVDRMLGKVIKRLNEASMTYSDMLVNIPSFSKNNMHESLLMPDVAPTRQAWWALLLTRIIYMKFLIDIGGVKGIKRNKDLIYNLQLDIKQLKRENIIDTLIKSEVIYDLANIFKEIESI